MNTSKNMEPTEDAVLLSSQLTSTSTKSRLEPSSLKKHDDYLIRIITGLESTSSVNASICKTEDFEAVLAGWANERLQDIDSLKAVVRWQHSVIDYNAVYQAYLMDQLTDDEFELEAEKFVYDTKSVDPNDLAAKIQRVYQLTNIQYTPSDLGDLFQCEHSEVMRALALVHTMNPAVGHMLPERDQ